MLNSFAHYRVLGCGIGLFFFVVGVGCSTPKVPKYPADHARFGRIVQAVESLRQAYVQKDEQALRELFLPLEALDRMSRVIRQDFETYSEIVLDLSVERIRIQGDLILVHVRWQGEWKQPGEVVGTVRGGHGILRLRGTQVVLMAGVEGDIPFGMASRQALS